VTASPNFSSVLSSKATLEACAADPISVDRPLAARRAKEIAVINEHLIKESDEDGGEGTLDETIEKIKESAQRRKEIEQKVINCTVEFDRQQTSESLAESTEESAEMATAAVGEDRVKESESNSLTSAPSVALGKALESEGCSFTQSQLKSILRVILIILFAALCGSIPSFASSFAGSRHVGLSLSACLFRRDYPCQRESTVCYL
jgi:hypothetical protein